ARVEHALRQSQALRRQLQNVLLERDRGEHSIGAVWRRRRLSCPTREHLGSFLLQVLDKDHQDYVTFHLDVIVCPFCQANLADLRSLQEAGAPPSQARPRRYLGSSAGYLKPRRTP